MGRWRKLGIALGSIVALLFIAALVLPYFFDVDAQKGVLSSRLEGALGRKVKLGKIRLSLFPPSLRMDDAEIAEALGFTSTAFSTAKQLRARVRLMPLLQGRLEVPSIELEEPVVHLVKNAKGEWNFASLGRPAAGGGPAGAAPPPPSRPIEIGELRIRNGTLTVTDLQNRRPTTRFDDIDLTVKNFSRTRPFEFEVSARPPGSKPDENGRVEASGTGGPIDPDNLAASPAQGEVKFTNVDLNLLDAFTGQAGLGGLFTGQSKFSSDGKAARVEGDYRVDRLRLSSKAGIAQAPVSGKYQLQYDSVANKLVIQQFQLGSGGATAHTTGHLFLGQPASGRRGAAASAATINTDTRITNAPLADVARVLPALGVKLPAGSSLSGGAITAQLAVRGAAAQPSRRGSIDIRGARLSNYNIAGKLGGVVKLVGVDTGGKDTVIEQLKASFASEGGYTSTSDLLLVIPGMNITGRGGFSDAGPVNFQGEATLTRAGAVGTLLQRVTGASNVIPFKVAGTLENPVFQPDVGRMAAQRAQQPGGGGGLLRGLGGLFGKKQAP